MSNGWVDPFGLAGENCDKLIATLKKPPVGGLKPHQEKALQRGVNDVLNGKGIPRIDPKTGQQTIFTGAGKIAPKKWAGSKEWAVYEGNNDFRILTKDLGNGKIQIEFTPDHYHRIFAVIIKE